MHPIPYADPTDEVFAPVIQAADDAIETDDDDAVWVVTSYDTPEPRYVIRALAV